MAEVRQVPGKVFVDTTDDGEVKQVPGQVFFTEEAAAAAATRGLRKLRGVGA